MKTEYKSHPVEYFHAKILDNYHVWRKNKGTGYSLTFEDGSEFGKFIAEAKTELYKQFPELDKKP